MSHYGKLRGAKNLYFYNLDACDELGEGHQGNSHYQKQKMVRDVVKKYCPGKYHDVTPDPNSNKNFLLDFFKTEFASKGRDDMVLIYFDGEAGLNGKAYAWQFEHYPVDTIPVYPLIQFFVDSGVDVFLILDTQIPSRFKRKWQHSPGAPTHGNDEIVSCAERLNEIGRNRAPQDLNRIPDNDSTLNFCWEFEEFVEGIDRKYESCHAPSSLPHLLRCVKALAFNPQRLWLKKPSRHDDTFIARLVLCPDHIRLHKKIYWFAKQIQGPGFRKRGMWYTYYTQDDDGNVFLHEDEAVDMEGEDEECGDEEEEEEEGGDGVLASEDESGENDDRQDGDGATMGEGEGVPLDDDDEDNDEDDDDDDENNNNGDNDQDTIMNENGYVEEDNQPSLFV